MKFSEEQTHKVKLHHPDLGDLGEAQLRFGGDSGVVATMSFLSAVPRLDPGRVLDFVSATAEDESVFTLCDCRIHGFSLIATFLVYGKIDENRFLKIDVRYSDISEWFLRPGRVDGTVGEQLTWTRRSEQFSAEISDGTRQFKLSSKYVGGKERVGEDLILHEYVEFSFESSVEGFSLREARDKTTGLCALLSLLIAYPVSVISVEVYTKDSYARPFYFGTFNQRKRDNTRDFSIQCFIQKFRLDGQWPSILNYYYQDHKRRELWIRLSGMQRYEGFWDFRLLGYVGLLDRCVAQRTQALSSGSSPPSQRKVDEFGAELPKLASTLDQPALNAIVDLAKRSFGNHRPSFADRYTYAMEHTDEEVRAVINLTAEDFKLIKKVRDRLAHGEPPDVPDGDFPRVTLIIAKIRLLLTYWMFHDLGISKADFLGAMNATHNPMYLQASVDRKSLARATRTAAFFNVSAEKFELLASRKELRYEGCLIEGPIGEIEFSAEHTQRRESWRTNPARASGSSTWEAMFEVENGVVKYHGTVYIESGDKTLELSSVCIFDRSKLHSPDKTPPTPADG